MNCQQPCDRIGGCLKRTVSPDYPCKCDPPPPLRAEFTEESVRYGLTDTGARKTGPGGMLKEAVRKPRFTLLDIPFLRRCAEHMTKGAEKYGPDNWRLANSLEEQRGFQDSAWRHLLAWVEGQDDEDHAAAIVANVMMAEATKGNIQ